MRSSLPAVRRSAALLPPLPAEAGPAPPAPARGGGAAEWGRASPLRSRPRPGRREGEGGRAARPVSRRPYPGPAPERGESGGSAGRAGGAARAAVSRPARLPVRAARPLRGSLPARVSSLALQLRELQAVYSEWGKGGKVGRRPRPAEKGGRGAGRRHL